MPFRSWYVFLLVCLSLSGAALADDPIFELHFRDHAFTPASLSVPASTRFRLTIVNDESAPVEFESVDFHREKLVLPGRQITLFVGPLDPGKYEFFDDFLPDRRGWIQALVAAPAPTSLPKAKP